MCCIQDDSPDDSDDSNVSVPHFTSKYRQKVQFVYVCSDQPITISSWTYGIRTQCKSGLLTLTDANSTRWQALTTPAVKQKLTIKIPGGKLADM